MIIIDHGVDIGIITLAIINMFAEYVPRTLFASAMWFLASTPKGTDDNEENNHSEVILSQTLANDDDKYLFPN